MPCIGCQCTLCLKEERERKEGTPMPFPDSNSTVVWRVEYCDASIQLDWSSRKQKVLEAASSSLLPRGIPRVGGRRRKQNRSKSTLKSLSCISRPWVTCHPLPKTSLLLIQEAMVSAKSTTMATVTPSSLCLNQASFLPPS